MKSISNLFLLMIIAFVFLQEKKKKKRKYAAYLDGGDFSKCALKLHVLHPDSSELHLCSVQLGLKSREGPAATLWASGRAGISARMP